MERRKNRKNTRGSVMLETLLVLPLYLVMLSGVFWLGELCMTRLTLTHGERLRLWETGNWHSREKILGENVFGFLERGTNPRLVTGFSSFQFSPKITSEAQAWGSQVSGHAEVTTRRSEWSWGIDNFVRRRLWADMPTNAVPGSGEERMFARTDPFDNPLDSLMLFRSGNTAYRNNQSAYYNSNRWNEIYLGKWGEFITPSILGAPSDPVIYYTRNYFYQRWSR